MFVYTGKMHYRFEVTCYGQSALCEGHYQDISALRRTIINKFADVLNMSIDDEQTLYIIYQDPKQDKILLSSLEQIPEGLTNNLKIIVKRVSK